MSIFGKIKDAIFGKKKEPEPAAAAPVAPTPAAPAPTAAPVAAPAAPVAISEVDVEAILAEEAAKQEKGEAKPLVPNLLKPAEPEPVT